MSWVRSRPAAQQLFSQKVWKGQLWSIVPRIQWSKQSSQKSTRSATHWQERLLSATGSSSKTSVTQQTHQPLEPSWTAGTSHHLTQTPPPEICLQKLRLYEVWCLQTQYRLSSLRSNGGNIGVLSYI
jgi:hypothetical protein